TVDTFEKNNLQLAEISNSTKEKLRQIVHPEGSVNNPIDLLPGGTAEQFKSVIEILLSDDNVDSVISLFVEPIMVEAFNVVETVNSINGDKPVFQIVMPLPEFWEEYRLNSKSRKPLFRNPEDVSIVIKNMLFHKNASKNSERLKKNLFNKKYDLSEFNGKFISQSLVNQLMKSYSIPTVEQKTISIDEIEKIDIKYPIVIKAIGDEIIHKSELGAVIVDVKNFEELKAAINQLKVKLEMKSLRLEKLLIQDYLKTKFELLIGAFRDKSFGPMIMFGSGGKYVEYIDDVKICSAYLNESDLENLINSTKIGKIIQGVRGEKSVDINSIKLILKNLAQMVIDYDEIKELDINPLIITQDHEILAVDVRIKC
ncbi:MAG: acetate--CoA ligase family protein, partial [Ignavibacterium sp.]|nr:acetate--CoA ligase family protein [Ignavibacterium sp.]